MSSCSYHASKEAIGSCLNCGKLICTTCSNLVEGKTYCPRCVEKLFPAGHQEETVVLVEPKQVEPVSEAEQKQVVTQETIPPITVAAEPTTPVVIATTTKPVTSALKSGAVNPLWWLAVLLGGWIGGLLAWLLNRDRQPSTSKHMLFGGIGWSILQLMTAAIIIFATIIVPSINTNMKPATVTAPAQNGKTEKPAGTIPTAVDKSGLGEADNNIRRPIPAYQTTTLFTQNITASDREQVVKYEDKVSIVIPAGEIKEQQKVAVSSVTNAPAAADGDERLCIYDISFEKQPAFSNTVTFSFAYDPASLPAGANPAQVLRVATLDVVNQLWVYMPATIDTAHNRIEVNTQHNGLWQVIRTIKQGTVLVTDHYAIFFNPDDFGQPVLTRVWELLKKIDDGTVTDDEYNEYLKLNADTRWTDWGAYSGKIQGSDKSYYDQYRDVPRYVLDIAYYAEKAWSAYESRLGKNKTPVQTALSLTYVNVVFKNLGDGSPEKTKLQTIDLNTTDVKRLPIYLNKNYGNPAYYGGFYKSIYIGHNLPPQFLPELVSHEVFHAVQNLDYNLGLTNNLITNITDATRLTGFNEESYWWLESTAEYAAYKLACSDATPSRHKINLAYLATDFFSPDEPDRVHAYQNAWFLDYLTSHLNASFSEMYLQVADSSALSRHALSLFIQMNAASSLYDAYRQFADYLFFGTQSPIAWDQVTAKNTVLASGKPQVVAFKMPSGLTADQRGMTAVMPSGADKRKLRLTELKVQKASSWLGDSPYLALDIYRLTGNQRMDQGADLIASWDLSETDDPDYTQDIELSSGDGLYFVVTCYSPSSGTQVQFKLDDTDFKLSVKGPSLPDGTDGVIGDPYEFTRSSTGIPQNATYTWYVDGKSEGNGEETLKHQFWKEGSHSVSVKAKWDSDSTESNKLTFRVGTPSIKIKSPLSPGEKGSAGAPYTFTTESKYVPRDADYSWTINNKEISGGKDTLTYQFNGTDTFQVKVKAEWPVPDSKPASVGDSLQFTVGSGFQISADPVPGIVGTTVKFRLTGEGIPANAGFSWDFGKQEGGISTNSADASVTHVYEQADSYTVTVTAVDRSSGKSIGKASLQYTVILQPYVKIEPRSVAAKPGEKVNLTAKLYSMPGNLTMAPRYNWTITRDNASVASPQGESISYTLDKSGQWKIMVRVQARDKDNRWIKDQAGNDWLEDSVSINVEGAPTLTIVPPKELAGGPGQTDTAYSFSKQSNNIPDSATYTWNQDGQAAGQEQTATLTFKSGGPHSVKLTASWTDRDGMQQEKTADFTFDIGSVSTSLQIIPPAPIEDNRGVVGVKYFFTLIHEGFPAATKYNWYVNGKFAGSGEHGWFKFNSAKSYVIKAIAVWTDGRGAEQKRDDQVTCNIKDLSIEIIAPGKTGITGQAYTFGAKYDGLPPGAKVEWYFEGGKKYQGDSAKHTFDSTGDKTIRVQITPSTGVSSLASDEVVFKVTSFAIKIISPLPAGQKGVSGKDYLFTLDTAKIPADARATYSWYVNGSSTGDGPRLNAPAVKAGKYSIRAVGKVPSGGSPVEVEDNLIFEVEQGAVVQITPRGGTGEIGKAYSFTATGSGLPAGARYEWYFEGGNKYQGQSATHTFASSGDKSVLVMVYAGNAVEPLARDEVTFRISAGAPVAAASIKIKMPVSVGVIGATYTFDVITTGIPANATYTWEFGGTTKQGKTATQAYSTSGDFPVKVTAQWVENGKSGQLSDSATMKIAANTPTAAKAEVNFAVWRYTKTKVGSETVKNRQYCQDYSINLYRVEGGKNVLANSGSSYYRNGAFEIVLPVGHYMYEVNYKYVDPGADSGRRTGYFDVKESGSNLVDVETPPYEKTI